MNIPAFPQARHAVVLGTSGDIGTNLVPRLAVDGWEVRAAGRNRLACRDWNTRCDSYTKRGGDEADPRTSIDALWREILLIGPDGDFFYANWLWRIRRLTD